MDLLAELNAARENITVLEGTIATHVASLATANATVASNAVEIASITEARTAAQNEVTTVRAELATANGSLATANATLAERDATIVSLRAESASAEQRVIERLGRGGKPAAKKAGSDVTGEIKTRDEALIAYNKITDPRERSNFYAEHKELMFPAKK